ncbi:LLM class flavin-dependent oxidoreductase [Actinokineospora iranica]|uniref:Flavin-dependent oxidoreductase, luciferase family (Includes alkanesulfonate monooxygenase SsuD and methylene tetrahydromethanopterin reductase) n=1 Tax=Actinokineospora iranica TaxID=1271860 RepID=A0A1G6P8U5_9PSEU|nr:LLM class flavin-dependent oxidoreductase [Actinokineospora iranica]SDC76509.1 Flavin-dependent oxidoreductase, luciferase family (includes alkanesulfonate monooxygenase SsuD and methylene tetrahydromethanopterin reductase) [Actinokineospora iranica]
MRVGIVILPEHRWWAAEPCWRGAEEYGFDHAWTYDHLGWRTLVDGPWFDSITTLTAAAMVTSRIRLGTLVATPHFRHPVPFARQILAIDDISDGRFLLGLGSGASGAGGYDRVVMGNEEITPDQVADRFDEFVRLTDSLLIQPKTTHSGEFYRTTEARSAPGCVQRPRVPFVVAANGPRAMLVAARHGQGWVTTGSREATTVDEWWRDVERRARRFDGILAAQRRDPAKVARYVSVDASPLYSLESVGAFQEHVGRARDAGFTDVITHWPRADGPYAGRETVLEEVAADVLPLLGGWATRQSAAQGNGPEGNGPGPLGVREGRGGNPEG